MSSFAPRKKFLNFPFLAATAGKDGRLFLLDRNNLGGFTPGGPDNVLDTQQSAGCWCGPSFFTGSDKIGRVLTSHGTSLNTWQVQLSPAKACPGGNRNHRFWAR